MVTYQAQSKSSVAVELIAIELQTSGALAFFAAVLTFHLDRARRVKCDEQRPACQKCLSTGRKCDGYKNTREWIVIVAPPPAVTDGFEDDRSRRHFDYFRSQAVHELSWFFEGGHWGDLVLRETHSSAAVRHAVLALAASHEDFRDHVMTAAQAPQYNYAANHYSKAIRNLIKETSDEAQASRMRALMCGLLFIAIEVLRGNSTAALHHLDGCLKIVRETQATMGTPFIPYEPHPLERDRPQSEAHLSEDIIPMFARLDVQASLVFGQKTQNRGAPGVEFPDGHTGVQLATIDYESNTQLHALELRPLPAPMCQTDPHRSPRGQDGSLQRAHAVGARNPAADGISRAPAQPRQTHPYAHPQQNGPNAPGKQSPHRGMPPRHVPLGLRRHGQLHGRAPGKAPWRRRRRELGIRRLDDARAIESNHLHPPPQSSGEK
ncbi:hypothetical protein K505DRAFT_418888 [Melanomma pulvis-pyrius CBS 109.77]|uniref:Zn(2)-C6 fungal-type domain-containing protein n=1 Tax=Melanomma pulvis-pyrius CBS 109.77 TaxID=1314802 RepID=A0A6A6X777_9PLEO|nr:hypothetical protein K505DRAFT_418888 [Melanomma pulvis-pyrius CBS 109.77]